MVVGRSDTECKTAWETIYAIRDGRRLVKPTFQGTVYNFLERPKGWKSVSYHAGILAAVLACLVLSILTTVVERNRPYAEVLYFMEIVLVIFLTVEYILRLWSAGCRSKYMGVWGRLRFISKPISVIDLIIIIASVIVLIFGSNGQVFATSAVRGVRFLQILRMLHMDRQGGSWRLLGSVVYMHRQELLTTLYIGFLGLIFSSYFMYLVEKDVIVDEKTPDFASYADALWWGVVTMMTIGYGDKVPHTWAGRVLACVSAMFTVSFFALPAGILGSGFALKVQQQQRQKHFSRQIPAAATLIQCLWRCYAADKKFNSVATWEIHMKGHTVNETKYKGVAGLRRRPKGKDLRIPFGRRQKDIQDRKSLGEIAVDIEVPEYKRINVMPHSKSVPDFKLTLGEDTYANRNSMDSSPKKENGLLASPSLSDIMSDENENESPEIPGFTVLTETHKNAIRAVRKIKYFVAKRKFQQARKPYDVGDVIEQYTQGQLSTMVRIKELQRRLDQALGKPYPADKSSKPVTFSAKLQQLENMMLKIDKKLDNINLVLHAISRDIANQQRPREYILRDRL